MRSHTKIAVFSILALVTTVAVVALIITVSSSYLDSQYAKSHQGCLPGRANHSVVIQNNAASPAHPAGSKCDTLTITNLDDTQRIVAFGPHEDHVAYDGIAERSLTKGQGFSVTLIQLGDFRFHDHLHDEVAGTFTVVESK